MNPISSINPTTVRESGPPLVFDDGSRVFHATITNNKKDDELMLVAGGGVRSQEEKQQEYTGSTCDGQRRPSSISIREYYEIDRLCYEIRQNSSWFRIALQFPDELLEDAPDVCWEFEQDLRSLVPFSSSISSLPEQHHNTNNKTTSASSSSSTLLPFLIFCLGGSTSCCPDYVAAEHLQADCIIHYGHACLSSIPRIPVLYSFGNIRGNSNEITTLVDACVESILNKVLLAVEEDHDRNDGQDEDIRKNHHKRFVLLYEVAYQYAIEEIQNRLQQCDAILEVITGQVPETSTTTNSTCRQTNVLPDCVGNTCHENDDKDPSNIDCCSTKPKVAIKELDGITQEEKSFSNDSTILRIGGLCLPDHPNHDWSHYTLLYIGNDQSRHFICIALQLLSMTTCPQAFWCWYPRRTNQLMVNERNTLIQRQLRNRFYQIEKARICLIFGIVVTNLSDLRIQSIVIALQQLLLKHHRTFYMFVVGKVNPATLMNFAVIQCFILVSCPEQALIDNSTEFPIPIITPVEMAISLGVTEWGANQYSLQNADFLKLIDEKVLNGLNDDSMDDEEDAPYFSLATGRYEPKPNHDIPNQSVEMSNSSQQLMVYSSAAANFLKTREYQGLHVEGEGILSAHQAIPGQSGIASNYNSR